MDALEPDLWLKVIVLIIDEAPQTDELRLLSASGLQPVGEATHALCHSRAREANCNCGARDADAKCLGLRYISDARIRLCQDDDCAG